MGGRTAVRVADDGQVVGVVMLAPWLPPDEPTTSVSGKRVFIAHGAGDRWVPGRMSLAWANRAVGSARELRRVELRGTDHPMLRRSSLWHDLTTYVVARYLDLPFAAPRSMASLDAADPTNLRLAL
jgi:dienelactone hydrolase